jgi:hypothetical protein
LKERERKQYYKQYKEYSKGGYYKDDYRSRGGYYQSYRGRGSRGRGRAGSRGRGYKQRYDEDRYFQQELGTYTQFVELPDKVPVRDIKEESAEDDFLFSDNNKSPSPKRIKNEQKFVKPASPKKLVVEDQSNIFNTRDTPKNIISNIKDFIDSTPDEREEKKYKKENPSIITIQNTSFGLINKQPEKQTHKITNIQTTFSNSAPKKDTPNIPEGTQPYMMPYPMFYYPQGYDPNMQQQGQYPPMYYFVQPYGMNPNDVEDMRRKGNYPQYNPNVILK